MEAEVALGRHLDALAADGLNWAAFVQMTGELAAPTGLPVSRSHGLLVFLARGSSFARKTEFLPPAEPDPFDSRSRRLVETFVDRFLRAHDPGAQLVFPAGHRLDLRAWLLEGGVQYASPLRTGIRPDCGPWFAVRAAVWTSLPGNLRAAIEAKYPPLARTGSPCDVCHGQPCVHACPVNALAAQDGLSACISYRLSNASHCETRCLARSSCPVGRDYRYPSEQMAYHYGVSLAMLRRWQGHR